MLVYVHDVLQLAKDAQEYTFKLNQVYQLKKCFWPPDRYLKANVDKFQSENGRAVWSMTCVDYLQVAIKNIYLILEGKKTALKSFRDGHRTYP